jgi:hypothetical protein
MVGAHQLRVHVEAIAAATSTGHEVRTRWTSPDELNEWSDWFAVAGVIVAGRSVQAGGAEQDLSNATLVLGRDVDEKVQVSWHDDGRCMLQWVKQSSRLDVHAKARVEVEIAAPPDVRATFRFADTSMCTAV